MCAVRVHRVRATHALAPQACASAIARSRLLQWWAPAKRLPDGPAMPRPRHGIACQYSDAGRRNRCIPTPPTRPFATTTNCFPKHYQQEEGENLTEPACFFYTLFYHGGWRRVAAAVEGAD